MDPGRVAQVRVTSFWFPVMPHQGPELPAPPRDVAAGTAAGRTAPIAPCRLPKRMVEIAAKRIMLRLDGC